MKNIFSLILSSIFIFFNVTASGLSSNPYPAAETPTGACLAFYQYTLGQCPTVGFFDGSTASGSILAWSWDFGDGGTHALQNPAHTYAANGSYIVCLTISTDDFCQDTYCDTITITCIAPPSCQASYQYTLGQCPTVGFFDGSTASGSILAWSWDFGDGGTHALQNPTHTYGQNGTYLVCLTISTDDFCQNTYCDSITVSCLVGIGAGPQFGNSISLFPTPCDQYLNLSFEHDKNESGFVEVFDYSGKLVLEKRISGIQSGENLQRLETASLSPGIYILKVKVGDSVACNKFVVQH